MSKKNWLLTLTGLALLIPLILAALRYDQQPPCPPFDFSQTEPIIDLPTDPSFTNNSVFPHDLNKDAKPDFVIFSMPSNRQARSPISIALSTPKGYRLSPITGVSTFFHARHISFADLNSDGFDDVLIADHGPDVPPFPGAQSGILLNQNGRSFFGIPLPIPASFNFHINPVHVKDRLFILHSNMNPPTESSIRLLEPHFSGNKMTVSNVSHLLPRNMDGCYMTSAVADLIGDENEEIAIGACDRPNQKDSTPWDYLLTWNGKSFEVYQKLPSRPLDVTWATVSWAHQDFNGDGKIELVRLTHDYGFKTAAADLLFLNPQGAYESVKIPYTHLKDLEAFAPWPHAYKNYLMFSLSAFKTDRKDRPQLNFFYHVDGSKVKDASHCLPPELKLSPHPLFSAEDGFYMFRYHRIDKFKSMELPMNY